MSIRYYIVKQYFNLNRHISFPVHTIQSVSKCFIECAFQIHKKKNIFIFNVPQSTCIKNYSQIIKMCNKIGTNSFCC